MNGHYQISKVIRDMCVFARHNLASDPPFSHLDLITCRNVLIYMDAALQKRVLPVLHYALNSGGFLFLGSSESIGSFTELFGPVDQKHRIFTKKQATHALPLEFRPSLVGPKDSRLAGPEAPAPLWSALDVQREADRLVLGKYAPVGVVIDEAMTVLQFRGRTAPDLEPAPGMASLDLLRMLREGLMAEVRAAVTQARVENSAVVREGLRLTEGGETRTVRVEVVPFRVAPTGVRFFLVMFRETPPTPAPPPGAAPEEPRPAATEHQIGHLQQELSAMRDHLQSVIEEQESTNEELKSANEEILSANEELQSTNEELQTAKEEAQSANEELATVNEELRHRNAELARVNNDLVNLLSGVGIPIVMVGRDLRLRRHTPMAEKVFNLIPTDVGRPMSDIQSNLEIPNLTERVAKVIDTLTAHESEVRDKDGHAYLLRIRPYVTIDNKIDGASIVVLEIDALKRGLTALPETKGETDRAKQVGGDGE
jgi:two-component system CheB/CheR fusion protein